MGETERGKKESSTDSGVDDDEAKVPLLHCSLVASFSPLQSTAGKFAILVPTSRYAASRSYRS